MQAATVGETLAAVARYEFGGGDAQPLVLRGATDMIAISFNGVTPLSPLVYINVEWIEA
ncbi:hypothetical protein [Asticcacaulis sp. AC402]|uniref:hypothetical protein n=1 Tax=Asticcacaulis sp. AC402 TaxID=1282361 RepID=UPI000428053C|nr:hypothetical protein [Asticcacaulis sp. AC402]